MYVQTVECKKVFFHDNNQDTCSKKSIAMVGVLAPLVVRIETGLTDELHQTLRNIYFEVLLGRKCIALMLESLKYTSSLSPLNRNMFSHSLFTSEVI